MEGTFTSSFRCVSGEGCSISSVTSNSSGSSKVIKCSSTQTRTLSVEENETQTEKSVDVGVQTLHGKESEDGAAKISENRVEASSARVAAFLRKVAPQMESQLTKNAESLAFVDSPGGASVYSKKRGGGDIKEKFTFIYEDSAASKKLRRRRVKESSKVRECVGCGKGMQVTGLSWNSSGSVLVVAYGRTDHKDWCSCVANGNKPALCAWSIFRRDLDTSRPHMKIETQSCVTSVACHPEDPAIVAAGTFNGELLVWSTVSSSRSRDTGSGTIVARSQIGDYFHREPITSIEWVGSLDERGRFARHIATVSGDGKVLLWALENKLSGPVEGYLLASREVQSLMRGGVSRDDCVGGLSLSFCKSAEQRRADTSFVVGTESGRVMRCFRSKAEAPDAYQLGSGDVNWTRDASRILARVKPSDMFAVRSHVEKYAKRIKAREIDSALVFASQPEMSKLFPPASGFAFKGHSGPVYALDTSPFERNLFVSAGANGTICLNSMLRAEPVRVIDTRASFVFDVSWSRSRPAVFAAATECDGLQLFDLDSDAYNPVSTLLDDSSLTHTCVAFNPKQRAFMASGDAEGSVHVWHLPWFLANRKSNEDGLLREILADSQ